MAIIIIIIIIIIIMIYIYRNNGKHIYKDRNARSQCMYTIEIMLTSALTVN